MGKGSDEKLVKAYQEAAEKAAEKWLTAIHLDGEYDADAIMEAFPYKDSKVFVLVEDPSQIKEAIEEEARAMGADDALIGKLVSEAPHCLWDYYLFAFYESVFAHDPSVHEWVQNSWFDAVKAGLGHIVNLGDLIIGVPVAKVSLDDEGRFHSEDGPAVKWTETETYWWHGIRVSKRLIMDPDSYTSKEVLEIDNQETKRVTIERLGYERVLKDLNPKKIATDDWAELWELAPEILDDDDGRPARFVRVVCPSTGRVYPFNRVPPQTRTPVEAVSLRFGATPEEFTSAKHS